MLRVIPLAMIMALAFAACGDDETEQAAGSASTGPSGGGAGGSAGPTCAGIGRTDCPADALQIRFVCPRVAYKCTQAIDFTTASSCNVIDDMLGNPSCCVPRADVCAQIDTVDCAALGGLEECRDCADDNGPPPDPNNCLAGGAACTTNDQCCEGCCAGGTCTL